MATFSVTDQTRRAQYTANGSTTEFSFSFQVNNTSDIKVDVNGTTKTESTHYDIKTTANSNGLNTDGTGKVVFRTSPSDHTPANNEIVTIYSDHPLSRTSVYTSGGNITAASLENDFDTITMVLGSHEERMNRAIQAPVTDPVNVDLTLPIASTRASKIMGFDANGDFVVDSSSSLSLVFDTVTIGTILATNDLEFKPSGGQVNILGTSGQQRITFNNDSTPTIDIYQNSNITKLSVTNPTATRTIIFPDDTGVVALTSQLDLVNDTSPQLGGTLDLNGNRIEDNTQVLIKGSGSADIDLQAAGGQVNILDGSGNQRITFNNDGTPSINTFGAFSIDGDNTIDINSTGDFTVDSSGDIILDADGGEIYLKDGGTTKFTFRVSAAGNRILGDSATTIETSAGAIDIKSASGNVDFLTNSGAQSIQLQSTTTPEIRFYQNSNTLDVEVATLSGTRTLTLPDATDTLVGKATTDTLTNKTLTSAVLNSSVSGTAIKDEDTMSSNSPNHLATQQSIKAYVDSRVATVPTGDITGVIAGTGITGGGTSGTVTLNINATTGLTATSSTLSIDSTVVTKTGTQTLTNKTLTSPVLNTGVSGTAIKDEDDLVSNSASHLATQQSIKAYVDAQVAGGGAGNLSTVLGIGNTTAGNNIVFGDSSGASDDRLTFGADADLQIYHDGSNSRIADQGTGGLILQGDAGVYVKSSDNAETMAQFVKDGEVSLWYDNVSKLATTSSGVDVTGTVTADGLTVDGDISVSDISPSIALMESDTTDLNTFIASSAGDFNIFTRTDAGINTKARLKIDHSTGDISFYEDTGTTAKLFWDASAESLGIGNTNPSDYHSFADNLVVGTTSGNNGITISSGTTSQGSLFFADGTSSGTEEANGYLVYVHGQNYMAMGTENSERMRIVGQNVGIGTSSPTSYGNSQATLVVEDSGNPAIALSDTGQARDWFLVALGDGLGVRYADGGGSGSASNVTESAFFKNNGDVIVKSGNKLQLNRADDARSMKMFTDNNAGNIQTTNDPIIIDAASGRIRFDIASSEKMRIETAENGQVLFGKTTNSIGTAGTAISSSLGVRAAVSNNIGLLLNRLNSNGEIINLRRDNTTVGSITAADTNISISAAGVNNCGWAFLNNSAVSPMKNSALADNLVDLGSSSHRMDDIHATNGNIQTSDQREKQQIASLTDAEITAAKAISKLFKTFKWNDKVEAKGDAARTHTGVVAQQVEQAMADAGLDASKYAFWCSNTWWQVDGGEAYDTQEEAPENATERNRKGIRYPELLSFIGAATEQRLTSIEARLEALEAN